MGSSPGLVLLLCLALAALAGCASVVVTPPTVAAPPEPTGSWRAGAARVDLTPTPGFPMGGHSLEGQTARGYWTRLYANAIYLEDPEGQRLALVSCDLWSMPAGLADRVAELVAADRRGGQRPADRIVLTRDQLLLAATHTHQSPGNYSTASAYNTFGSPHTGFDRRLFEFLAHRISEAIRSAARAARPAVVTYAEGPIAGLVRNRSFSPFLRDVEEARSLLADNARLPELAVPGEYPPTPFPFPRGIIYRAVRPRLAVLSMHAPADRTDVIGVAAFVAVHPTSMSARTPLYTSDFFGVAAILSAHTLGKISSSGPPVVAIFNGAEGDVSPSWQCRDPKHPESCQQRTDAIALGRILATRITELSRQGQPVAGSLEHRFARGVQLAGQCLADQPSVCTAKEPMIGAPMLGGTPDGRGEAHRLGWREGVTGPATQNQGRKQPALDPKFVSADSPVGISRFVMGALSTPNTIPLGLYLIGPVLLASVPGEFTTVMGLRIERALAKTMADQGRPVQHVILVGLAHEYISYFTTPEEYALQFYEGASTAYGPASGPLVQDRLTLLARQFTEPPAGQAPQPEPVTYSPGTLAQYGICDIKPPAASTEGLGRVLQDDKGQPLPDPPKTCWSDRFVILSSTYARDRRVTPNVSIEISRAGSPWEILTSADGDESDQGINFVTTASATFFFRSEWCATWLGSGPTDSAVALRFHIRTLRGTSIYTPIPKRVPEPIGGS
jgi:neutral ceramidase